MFTAKLGNELFLSPNFLIFTTCFGIAEIVDKSLPCGKLEGHFKDPEAAKQCILNKIYFCEAKQKVI